MLEAARIAIIGLAALACACAPAAREPSAPAPDAAPSPIGLPSPAVIVEADPPPPFTYWAPEGSTIRNHPDVPEIWIAERRDGARMYYFGDQCRASEWQRFVGQPLSALPPPPEGAERRVFCTNCAHTDDLRLHRMNIAFDEATQRIEQIFCS